MSSSAVRVLTALALVIATATACTSSAAHHPAAPRSSVPSAPAPASDTEVAPQPTGTVSVYPFAGSRTALPQTQISFRNVAPNAIGTVTVTGSQSGAHDGSLRADSDRRGASFLPRRPFRSGETVTVHTGLHVVGGSAGSFTFRVATPVSDPVLHGSEADDPSVTQHFASAPSIQPPQLIVDSGHLDATGGDVFLAPKGGPGQDGPMIVGPDGRLVWFHAVPDQVRPYDVQRQTYRGHPVITWWQGQLTSTGHGQGVDEMYDDHYRHLATVSAGNGLKADHHEFTISSTSTALITAYQAMKWDTSSVGGPRDGVAVDGIVQEVDIPTGNVLFEWHALDHVPITDSYRGYGPLWDFFHVNSIQDLPGGRLLVGAKCTHQAYEIDKATGHIVWRLGGKHSDFTGNGNVFSSQHHIRLHAGNMLSIFDNATSIGPTVESRSRGLLVHLDFAKHTATVALSIFDPHFQYAANQGSMQLLPDGHWFMGWGSEPYLSEVDAHGRLIWEAHLPGSDTSYRAFRSPWTGYPPGRPALVARRSGNTVTADVSWNGATQVARWQLLGGPDAAHLTPLTTAGVAGFETTLHAAGVATVEAVALDAAGHRLGTSAPVQTG